MSHVDVCHDLGCVVAMSLRAGAMSHGRLGPVRTSQGWVPHIARHRNIAPATSRATSHNACAMSLHRPRARGDRATSQTACTTSQHRTRVGDAHRGGESSKIIEESLGHAPGATSRATSRKACAMSLHRSRARGRCCDVAQGGCDVARSPRARENVARVGAPHRTTSLHRTATARATSHKACAMSHATSAGVTCDIAPAKSHIAPC